MEKELSELQKKIADCDREIVQALKTRMECTEEMIRYKREHGLPVLQPERERKQMEEIVRTAAGTPFEGEIRSIFQEIAVSSKKLQAKTLFDKNIFLIGFMGAGKSTVSSCLGDMLAMETVEMDEYIEQKQGMKISRIFEVYGEEYFRNCESNTLAEMGTKEHTVVSCGGGVPLRAGNVALMKKNGYVIWLTAEPETILERVRNSTSRPLLNGHMNAAYIKGLMDARQEKYESAADIVICTTGKRVVQICEELLQSLAALQKQKGDA